jgi:hypothetical protein
MTSREREILAAAEELRLAADRARSSCAAEQKARREIVEAQARQTEAESVFRAASDSYYRAQDKFRDVLLGES